MSNPKPNLAPESMPWARFVEGASSRVSALAKSIEVLSKSVSRIDQIIGDSGAGVTVTELVLPGAVPGGRGIYYQKRMGIVHINLHVTRNTGTDVGTLLILPEGFRPRGEMRGLVESNGVVRCEYSITSAGVISLLNNVSSSTDITFHASFVASQ